MQRFEQREHKSTEEKQEMETLTDEQAHSVYVWVDKHTLSRPKRNIARDFADGILVAEILKFHFPQMVELHNYVSAFSQRQKVENWLTLKQKVFRRIGLDVDPKDLTDIANAVPMAIERFLLVLMEKIPNIQQRLQQQQQRMAAALQQHQHQRSQSREMSPSINDNGNNTGRRSSSQQGKTGRGQPTPAAAGPAASLSRSGSNAAGDSGASAEVVMAKDHEIANLRESTRLLTAKIRQLEELLKLRDSKIRILQEQVVQAHAQQQ